jgi:hypothetical protein
MKLSNVNIDDILENACARLTEYRKGDTPYTRPSIDDLEWFGWPQTWDSTTLGFDGVGGRAITTAQTVVVKDPFTGAIATYHGGRFAYSISKPSAEFWESVKNWNLPGASQTLTHLIDF